MRKNTKYRVVGTIIYVHLGNEIFTTNSDTVFLGFMPIITVIFN